MNNNQNQQYTPALGGFFGWLKRTVQNVANAVIQLSHNPRFIVDIIADAFDNDGSFTLGNQNGYLFRVIQTSTTEPPLTSLDEQKLDAWVQNKFLPYFKTFFSTLKDYSTNPPTMATFENHFNNVQKFISFLEWYKGHVLNYGEGSFSQNALIARNQFLDAQIELLEADIEDFMTMRNMHLNTDISNMEVITSKYSVLGFNAPAVVRLNVLKATNESNAVQLPGNSGTINPVQNNPVLLPSDTIPQIPQNTNTTNKSGGLFLWLLGVGAILAIRSLSNGEEQKRTKKQTTTPQKKCG